MKRTNHKSSTIPPSMVGMNQMLLACGIKLNKLQLNQLWSYHNLIRKRNNDRELTRIIGFEPMVLKHYVDSMIVGKFINLPSPLLDIGTGAGFPGIPLKIRYPHLKFVLAEPRPKRVAFLKEVCKELRLKNVEIFDHKVVSKSFYKPVAGVITRALETIDKTLLRTSACLDQGGLAIFLKGPGVDPEIDEVESRFGGKFKRIKDQRYRLPGTGHERRLVVYEKQIPLEPQSEARGGKIDGD